MATVTIHEAKTHLSRLIARALDGEEVVIAKGKEPKVRLVPVAEAPKRREAGKYATGRYTEAPGVWDPMSDDELREIGHL